MNESNSTNTNFYALLIGIDRYEANPYYEDLQGCARDIDLVANYVNKGLKVPKKHIWKLTSPYKKTIRLPASRFREAKPTYENIIKAFAEITNQAQSGEQVYIHYAGHENVSSREMAMGDDNSG